MVHRVVWRVASGEALDFWADRLAGEGVALERADGGLRFSDPEGLDLELVATDVEDEPLVAAHPDIPEELAIQGFDAVRAFSANPDASRALLENALAFDRRGEREWEVRGERRGGRYLYDEPPAERGFGGAGTVHHVAWSSTMEEHEAWRRRALEGGASPTPVIDRFYFRSIYFREPSGVLFEIATLGPGFATDEPADRLGERLSLPPNFEHLRERLEPVLTPLPNPRKEWANRCASTCWPSASARPPASRTARSCSSTGAEPTSSTSRRSSTCSTRSGGCSA